MSRDLWTRCDVCGKIISYADMESGAATRKMTLPDSHYSSETYETLCKKCVNSPQHPAPQDTAALVAEAVERLRYQTGIDQSWTLLSDIVSAVRRDERARCREVVEASCEHSMLNATMSSGAKERALAALDARGEA